jgi:hypothetical protein
VSSFAMRKISQEIKKVVVSNGLLGVAALFQKDYVLPTYTEKN